MLTCQPKIQKHYAKESKESGPYLPNIGPNFTIYIFQFIEVGYFMIFILDSVFTNDCIMKIERHQDKGGMGPRVNGKQPILLERGRATHLE